MELLPDAVDVGRVGSVRLNAGGGFAPLAQNVAYKPFGPLTAMTLGNGMAEAKGFDQNYQIASIMDGEVLRRTYTPEFRRIPGAPY
ncbi:MAG: hypothetical protein M0036_01140 [Desulfobacteraceae bacterium]|nr:hypothetical protein [Desulfobacteraceae bacterium]